MSYIPTWWEAVLLAGGSFRLWRLLAADTLLDWPRDWITGRDLWEVDGKYRQGLDIWLHCPWCSGFWITLGMWGAWLLWPIGTVVVCVPLALSAAVAITAKHLDA